MGLRINTNIASLNAQRNLGRTRFLMDRTRPETSQTPGVSMVGGPARNNEHQAAMQEVPESMMGIGITLLMTEPMIFHLQEPIG